MAHPSIWLQNGLLYPSTVSRAYCDMRRAAVNWGELDRAVAGPVSAPSCVERTGGGTARALQNDLQQATGVHVSDQTVRNRLHEAQHSLVGHVLTAHYAAFVREQQNCQDCHWQTVFFTDESRFTLNSCDMHGWVWRYRGECYGPWLLLGTVMKSSQWLSELTLQQWVLGSSWWRTMPGFMWSEVVDIGSSWMT